MFPVVSCTISGMNADHRKRLGQKVISRRTELGMTTTTALAEKAKLTPRMLGDVENGRRQNFSPGAKSQIEHALNWMAGSIDDVLSGLEPTRVEDVRPAPTPGRYVQQVDLTTIPGDALADELRRRMRPDMEYLKSKPVRRWTALVELPETNTEGEVHDVEAATESNASAEAGENQEELANGPQSFDAWDSDSGTGTP